MTNIAILTGRIARDPESRETKGGTNVTGITVVTDRPARDKDGKTYTDENGYTAKESEFHRVTCFNGLAKTVGQYCSKGQLVSVQGRIHYTQWEDEDGVTRYGTEILADKVDFLSRGNGSHQEDIMATQFQSTSTSDSYFAALAAAERRALHSFFDQHIIEDRELGYFALDEGDYHALPAHLAARVVHTVQGAMSDEF